MQIEGKGAFAEVCFPGRQMHRPPPSIIYPSFMQHIASDAMKVMQTQ